MSTFGKRLKQIRIENGYSQKQVATDMKMTYSAMSQYETGKRTPKNDILIKLATYFDVSVDYLLGRDKNPIKSYTTSTQENKYSDQFAASSSSYQYQTTKEENLIDADLSALKSRILSTLSRLPQNKQMQVLTAIELIVSSIIN